jgi:hypothetical protein
VKAVWTVPGFGSGKGSAGANAPIHFGDTQAAVQAMGSDAASANGGKPAAKLAAKAAPKKTAKPGPAAASRKARR